MSRRKQLKPRHLENEKGSGMDIENVPIETPPSPFMTNENGDAHVCGTCSAEFLDINEFLQHKEGCTKKRTVLFFDDGDCSPLSGARPSKRQALEDDVSLMDRGCSDGEEKQSLPDDMISETGKPDTLVEDGEDEDDENIDDDLLDDNDDFDMSSVNDDDEKANIEIEEEEKEKHRFDPSLKFNPEILARIQAMPLAFPHLFDNSNVVLEPMSGTKAAVAQFAENNVPPQDMAVLQSTLYNLQQQQIVQMHLIHQLQQQLIMGMGHGGNPNMSAHFNSQGAVTPPPLPDNKLSVESGDDEAKHKHSDQVKNSATSDSSNSDDYLPPSSIPRSEHAMYESEDPFFKHKCRVCGKVFGSDSGLQIHLRSHTGEKPFKCNICGNRFSTKGNLKVHFARHKEAYPYAEMNPHPVPEYLDSMDHQTNISKSLDPQRGNNNTNLLTTQATSTPVMATGSSDSLDQEKQKIKSEQQSSQHDSVDSESTSSQDGLRPFRKSEADTLSNVDIPKRDLPTEIDGIITEKPLPHSMPAPVLPAAPLPGIPTSFPFMSPLSSSSPFGSFIPPFSSAPPTSENSDLLRGSILPTKTIEPGENMDMYMEETRSETSKLKELVDNIERKITDPNQCVICHRVLSCKSALQMHYRIHTGERPFKCKICSRAFTTKGNLKTHLGVHRAKPPLRMMHQCPVCSKQFTNLLVLQQHIRMHSVDSFSSVPTNGMFPNYNWMHKPRVFPKEEQIKELDLSKPSTQESKDDDINNNINDKYDKYNEQLDRKPSLDMESNLTGHATDTSNQSDDETLDNKQHDLKVETHSPSDAMDSINSNDSNLSDEHLTKTHDKLHNSPIMHSTPTNGHLPIYSTSLAALEERVRAIDNSMSQKYNLYGACTGLNLTRRPHQSPNHQHEDQISPKSSSISVPEFNGHDSKKLSPSSLSFGGDSNSFPPSMSMLNPLDLRPGNGESKMNTTCNICYKTFACRSALDIHYRSHTKERPFQCDACDRSFSTKGNMKQHMLTHKIQGHPDYHSDDSSESSSCTPTYSQPVYTKPDTSSSETVSSKEQDCMDNGFSAHDQFSRRQGSKHQCNTCHKTFSSASALQIHIRTHTGDKPFKCNVCGKAFTTKGNLKVHMGTHMWNNSPSRRGRRMSIEPPFLMGQKENPFMPGFGHRPSEFFYQYPPFLNGLTPKLNEISVIQSLNGAMGHMLPPTSMSFHPSQSARNDGHSRTDSPSPKRPYEDFVLRGKEKESPSKHSGSQGEELDLSVKSSSSDSMRQTTSPSTDDNTGSKSSPENWPWKVSCHICSQSFPSHAALDYHIQCNHLKTESQQKPIVAQ